MRETADTLTLEKPLTATEVVESLPAPDYKRHYQPEYPDSEKLEEAVGELMETYPATTPEQIDALGTSLATVAEGETDTPVVVLGRCAEPIELKTPIEETIANRAITTLEIAKEGLGKAIVIRRQSPQAAKPRTSATEKGTDIPSYMGDAVNGEALDDRAPDPSRMVAAALQARDVEAKLIEKLGQHPPIAHEALLLAYEKSFMHQNPETGKLYLLSTDMPWIGKRTNDPDGEHVALLQGIENPIGIKIGPDSSPNQIAKLQTKLNPDNKPGKLTFMLRVGLENTASLPAILGAIKDYSPESIVLYDIHGSTKTAENGQKTRVVTDIIEEIKITSKECGAAGLKLHGVHLETTTDNSRLECVDEAGELPKDSGGVDPQLNPRQTKRVLQEVASDLL